jgi:hypothetical protein
MPDREMLAFADFFEWEVVNRGRERRDALKSN